LTTMSAGLRLQHPGRYGSQGDLRCEIGHFTLAIKYELEATSFFCRFLRWIEEGVPSM
jgi:hypothetical protein